MKPDDLTESRRVTGAGQRQTAGAIVRAARLTAGMTLADLGRCCGYSASQISRYERGVQPLTDITLLRRFAEVLAIPPQIFGLTPAEGESAGRRTGVGRRVGTAVGPSVGREFQREEGDDPVRRRELLARAAGLAGAAALGLPGTGRAQAPADPAGGLEDLLYGRTTGEPAPVSALRAATVRARADFQTARYERLAAGLPRLIAAATASSEIADPGERAAVSAVLADAYIVAANFMVKLNDDPLAWTTADRALQAAQAGDDPLTIADARRAVATVLRRTGRAVRARELLIGAACDIEPGGNATPDQLSMYGTLLQVAAYTAAVDGNASVTSELVGEAKASDARLGHDANHRFTAFGPTNVTLYQVSIRSEEHTSELQSPVHLVCRLLLEKKK